MSQNENKEQNAVTVIDDSVDISHAKELVAVKTQALALKKEAHVLLLEQAEMFVESGALPKDLNNKHKVYMVLKAGEERGLSEVESLNSFYFVHGKIAMYGPAVIAQVMKAGHIIEWGECDAESATVKITRGDNPNVFFKDTITIGEAKASGASGDNWKKHPRNMLKYRIHRMVASFVCPDALQGISVESDTPFVTNNSGRVIDVDTDPEYVVMTNEDIGVFCTRLTDKEGYSDAEIKKAIPLAIGRAKLGQLTQSEAELVEAKLKELRDIAAQAQEKKSTSKEAPEGEMNYDE